MDNWEGALFENNTVHDNAQINYPRSSPAIWPHSVIGFKSRDVTVISNRIHDNNGEGMDPHLGSDRWKILNSEQESYSKTMGFSRILCCMGVGIPQVKTDYLGRPRSGDRPSIGGFESPITVVEPPQLEP